MNSTVDAVESQIEQISKAAREVVRLSEEKYGAEKAARDFVEQTITALIGKPDPAGKEGKVHSLSSAETFAKKSEEYQTLKDTIQEGENALLVAGAHYEMVRLRARLAVSLVAVGEGA